MIDFRNLDPKHSPLRVQAEEETRRFLTIGCKALSIPVYPVDIDFDLRGTTAGAAFCISRRISYNFALLIRYPDIFMQTTVPHEVAHVLAWQKFQIRDHSGDWYYTMRLLGVENPARYHSYEVADLKGRQMRKFPYVCHCREHSISTIKHNRIQRGFRYRCTACQSFLEPKT